MEMVQMDHPLGEHKRTRINLETALDGAAGGGLWNTDHDSHAYSHTYTWSSRR